MTFLMLGSTPGRRRGAGRILAVVAILVVAMATWFVTVDRIEGVRAPGAASAAPSGTPRDAVRASRLTPETMARYGSASLPAAVRDTVEAVGRRLVEGSDADEAPGPIEVRVVGDGPGNPDAEGTTGGSGETAAGPPDAVALPDGTILVTASRAMRLRGDTLAAFLAHQIGHALAGHPRRRLARLAERAGVEPASVGPEAFLAVPRETIEEVEADRLAAGVLHQAGVDPSVLLALVGPADPDAAVRREAILLAVDRARREPARTDVR